MRPKLPGFVLSRREELRKKALGQGLRALKAVETAGGEAVIFGSVLRAGDFKEGSDIDICLLSPETYTPGNTKFFTAIEDAVEEFKVDISWYGDLKPTVKGSVDKEGKRVTSFCREL